MSPTQIILKSFITASFLFVFLGPVTACLSRRCLANELINKNLYSAPQSLGCVINVNLTSIQYKTLSVNTKTLQFSSRIKITMEWTDPDLKWSDTNYTFNEIMLPVKKIWTPDLIVENAIYLNIKPATNDVVVKRDGTVNYVIAMYTTVLCRINLLTYPFSEGSCPVAINGWNQSSCALQIQYGSVSIQGGGGTEWSTVSVNLQNDTKTKNHNYIYVTISSNPFKAMVSLILPSALIMIADLVSFALPLDGGKRSSFKITLVLSFTMFLLILTDYLPNTGTCSPLIRYHFCFCMFVLVMSMLISMVFTKVATEGNILCSKLPKLSKPDQTGTQFLDMIADAQSLRKIVNFVEKMDKKEGEIKKKQMLAAKLDKISFWAYVSLDVIYSICVIAFTTTDSCNVDNLNFCTEKNWNQAGVLRNMVSAKRILKCFSIVYYLLVCSNLMVGSLATCITRRCLASKLVALELFSPPMPLECAVTVNLTSIQYETLSVDTKALRFSSRIRIDMEWNDPDLAWTDTAYNFSEIMLPVDTIWTPDLTVDNSVKTEVKPVSTDILVKRDGTVQHAIQMYITVVCGINLFNYPFVEDACPVALNGWKENSCGLRFIYGSVSSVGASRGEWMTESVVLNQDKQNQDRNYLYVTMSTNPFNTIVTLILPSVLIMLADLGSFALPLEGGKRSSFKITLVLSFTMSLLLLTEHLPDTGLCSPLIRYHFCFCLIILGLSLLASMVFSRFAESGTILPCWRSKKQELCGKDEIKKDINLNGVSTISDDVTAKDASIQKILNFVENIERTNKEAKKRQEYASQFDRACFWGYLCLDILYGICIIAITRTEFCKINNLDFWI
ncbi:uncharacterized protein LOC131370144 [Hemibagrus wyckioides]|uniref:uncharacterized protein LOC131370144 n=1 Tax=Hemibagrus wyckioides TaxID=337641 RepID=UPI00266C89B7|nr:uncharacterized protein LOC131370144 [Hemibagrus wyckioides]